MIDTFREKLVSLHNNLTNQSTDVSAGIGITPSNQESLVNAKLLSQIITLYDKHFKETKTIKEDPL